MNERLGKPDFDCKTVTETYKCGCADTEEGDEGGTPKLPPGEDLLGPLPSHKKGGDTKAKKAKDGILEEARNPELKGVKLEIEG